MCADLRAGVVGTACARGFPLVSVMAVSHWLLTDVPKGSIR